MEIEHGGHIKFQRGMRTDKQFRRFLDDYSATVSGKYQTAADLPKPTDKVLVATGQHLRITDFPAEFSDKLSRVDLYRWTDSGWTAAPVASVDGLVNAKRAAYQGVVFASIPRSLDMAKEVETRRQLPDGRYLAKVFVDKNDNFAKNRDYELGPNDLIGQVEFDGPWAAGYQPPKIIQAPSSTATSN
jgi:hypothetical protein